MTQYCQAMNRISGVIVSRLATGVLECVVEPWSNQDYKTVMCCFSTKHTALRNKSKDWLG